MTSGSITWVTGCFGEMRTEHSKVEFTRLKQGLEYCLKTKLCKEV